MRLADVVGAVREVQGLNSSHSAPGTPVNNSPAFSLDAKGASLAQKLAEKRAQRAKEEAERLERLKNEERVGWKNLSSEFKSACAYFFFLGVFCAAVFGPRNASPYYLNLEVKNTFFEGEYEYGSAFGDVNSWSATEEWMQSMFLPNWLPTRVNATGALLPPYLMSDPDSVGDSVISDLANARVGMARLRALRVRDDTCSVPSAFHNVLDNCLGSFSSSNMDKEPHNGIPFEGDLGMPSFTSYETGVTYPGNGYLLDVPGNLGDAAIATTAFLGHMSDDNLRAILLDFSVYNVHADLFAVVTVCIEYLASGAVFSSTKLRISSLLLAHRVFSGQASSSETAFLVLELIMYGLVVFYILGEIKEMKDAPTWKEYFSDGWNVIDLTNYAFFIASFFMRMAVIFKMELLSSQLDDSDRYIDLVRVANLAAYADYVSAFNALLVFIKVFKYTHTNKRLAQFTDTLAVAYTDLVVLTGIILVVCLGYGLAFTLCFGSFFSEYRNVTESLVSLFSSVMGNSNLDGLRAVRPIAGLFLFLTFIYLMFFIVISMFLATVDRAYESVREALAEHKGDLDPLRSDLRRIGNKIKWVWHLLDEMMMDDSSKRKEAAEKRERAHLLKLREEKSEKRRLRDEAYRARIDPLQGPLGEELFKQIRTKIYEMELGQAELGKVLQKLDLHMGYVAQTK